MVSTICRSKAVQCAQYVRLHMPTFSWENLKNLTYIFILETFEHFTVDLLTTFFFYVMEQNRN